MDTSATDAKRVQEVHIQIHAGNWSAIAKDRLAAVEQMPFISE
ncbi:hypothetical protein [Xanthomonas cassavae]|nr:hypothetical protein [Xanthomonas cassavae]